MKISKVMVNRKFNLGNYETLDMAAEAELSETDSPLEVWTILRDNLEMEFTNMQSKTPEHKLSPFVKVPASQSTPQTPTAKPTSDPLVCKCGNTKKANFDQCYQCWDKARVPK